MEIVADARHVDARCAHISRCRSRRFAKGDELRHADIRRKAYVGWLGHTNARCKVLGWSKQELVDRANAMAREDYLLRETPSLTPRAVGFMGLKKVAEFRGREATAETQSRRTRRAARSPQAKAAALASYL